MPREWQHRRPNYQLRRGISVTRERSLLHRTSLRLAQGGHLRHRSNYDSYLVVERTRN
jgi:hypothetical protein